jgi:SAM-dependent methyltransferase
MKHVHNNSSSDGDPPEPRALEADAYDKMWHELSDFLRYNPGARNRRRLVVDAIRRHAPSAQAIADVGCGLGEMIAFLASRMPDRMFTGIDFSPDAIASCRKRFPRQTWTVADITNAELSGSFDAIICSELLEHLDEPDSAVRHVARMLAPAGTLIVTVPNGKVFATERAFGHVRHPTAQTLSSWFDRADLDVIELYRWGWPGYLAFKYAVNLKPSRALEVGSGEYSLALRRFNDLAYVAARVTSVRDHRGGPQMVAVGRRRAKS